MRGTKKVLRNVQRKNATTHSYTVHIQLNASGELPKKLPIVLFDEPSHSLPQDYPNLKIYWSKSDLNGAAETAKQWMNEVFLKTVEENSMFIIDAWTGYDEMMKMPQIKDKKLQIIQLPAGTSSKLQPADVYFNRPFKLCWLHNDFSLAKRENSLSLLDLVWYQFTAPQFKEFSKYSWYRAGYLKEHPDEFETPVQFCTGYKGYQKCENDNCREFCFLKCSHCNKHFCFYDVLTHRDV